MDYSWQLANWPHFHVNLDAVTDTVSRYRALCYDASKEYGLLDKRVKHDTLIEWLVSEAIATSAIEGENLNRDAVRFSILNHLGMHNPPLRVGDPKAEGVAALVLDVRSKISDQLTPEIFCQWRNMVVQPRPYRQEPLIIGNFRQSTRSMQIILGPVGYETVHYEAPPSARVPGEIDTFLQWYNDTTPTTGADQGIPGLVRAAVAHAWLELIHPFDDGNGRVGRAVAEHAICQDMRSAPLFSLSAAIEANKNTYYERLASVNRSLDFTEWVTWFCDTACQAQVEAQHQVAFALEKTRFWDSWGETAFNERQTKAFNRMFQAGPAGFEGGMTAKKYTSLTGASRATATRDLVDLADKGALKTEGKGRSVAYVLQLAGHQPDPVERMLSPSPSLASKHRTPVSREPKP